jgi:uncharacterized repeat protein (TIGR04138 family)
MTPKLTTHDRIETLAARDRRYASDAYHFVFETLDFVLEKQVRLPGQRLPDDQHISVSQLLDGLRGYAIDQYGPLARLVLERWGLYTTEDFGEIVFRLVESRLLNKQDSDRKSDFRNGFNFREAFDKAWRSAPKSRA